MIGLGVGFRAGEEAVAIGASRRFDKHVTVKVSASFDTEHRVTGGVGVGYEF